MGPTSWMRYESLRTHSHAHRRRPARPRCLGSDRREPEAPWANTAPIWRGSCAPGSKPRVERGYREADGHRPDDRRAPPGSTQPAAGVGRIQRGLVTRRDVESWCRLSESNGRPSAYKRHFGDFRGNPETSEIGLQAAPMLGFFHPLPSLTIRGYLPKVVPKTVPKTKSEESGRSPGQKR